MPRRGIDLSEEQWRNVKALAAKRGQTISAWFGDVIMEVGIGRATGKDYPGPSTARPAIPPIVPARKAQQAERDRILARVNRGG